VDWNQIDWPALKRLREAFLGREASTSASYWAGPADLESYDFTFGRRIAWKWASVLEPLAASGWRPPTRMLVDWGCGTGIGARSVMAHFGAECFDEVVLWDHSPHATAFAEAAIRARHPQIGVRVVEPTEVVYDGGFALVLSHVINELDAAATDALLRLAGRAAAVLWVEPGTAADSRALIGVRERLRGHFHCLAPCPHDGPCGLLTPENARHWCHHFARPPTEAFTDPGWARFGRELGIDLRSLPYSHLVLDRRAPQPRAPDLMRMIGEPRDGTGMMRILRCSQNGVAEVELQKRQAPALWRTLVKGRHGGLFRWSESDGRIAAGDVAPPVSLEPS
jgi:hypothetical protein